MKTKPSVPMKAKLSDSRDLVLVLDDQESVRGSLASLLGEHGYETQLHADPESLFRAGPPRLPSCLLLDNNLNHRKSGIDVHGEVIRRGWTLPIVFLTGEWDVQQVVAVVRAGANGFLTKPYDPVELLDHVRRALDVSRYLLGRQRVGGEVRLRARSLTPREREVVEHVLKGKPNKVIAEDLSIALITVKVHRSRAMKKLGVVSVAELASISRSAGFGS